MKDFSVNDIFASVKCEFVRRCTHSQVILARLADDLIGRYSTKPYAHPQFFKEDVALTCNQLTMYADECVQVMRKFDFLQRGADIVHSLVFSSLRLIDFFAKQLYHHLRESSPVAPVNLHESLCPSCGRLRQNERVRSLREELSIGAKWEEERALREMVVRRGEKYDEEELLYQSLESLEVLNEEEIRKRLGKMEADHDKHKKEILVAVEELTRANERVSTYSRALEKSGKQFSGKFNVKDYVFQLGRHFCHNISSLDLKIRLLKQSLNPITHQAAQTEQPVLLQSEHNQIIAVAIAETDRIKATLGDAVRSITIQQNKNFQLGQLNDLLQKKMQQSDVRREEEKIEEKVTLSQITNNLTVAENKIIILESLIRKLKGAKSKNAIIDPIFVKEEELIGSEDKISTYREDSIVLKSHRNNPPKSTNCSLREKQPVLINPKALLRLSAAKSNTKKSATQQLTEQLAQIMPIAPDLLAQFYEETRSKCTLVATINECYIPNLKLLSSQTISRKVSRKILPNTYESMHVSETASRVDFNEREKITQMEPIHHKERKKLSKIDVIKQENSRSSNHRESIHVEAEGSQQYLKKKQTQNIIAFQDLRNTFEEKNRIPTKKMLGTLKTSLALQTFKSTTYDDENLKKQFAERVLLQKRKKHKKTRNLSQQNSYDQQKCQNLRRSIEKMQYKERPLLGQKQRHLLLNPSDQQSKISFKNSLHRVSEGTRIILSLEEINYSTYFYSLIAKIHLKSQVLYESVRKFMSGLVPGLYDDDNSIKQSLNCILLVHRRCSSGQICSHLEIFLDKIKNL